MKPTESPFKTLKKVTPKTFSMQAGTMVRARPLNSDRPMPLLVEPALAGLDPNAWLAESRDQVEVWLAIHGAILFRGFGLDSTASFESFAQAICPDLYGEYGDLPHAQGKVYDVTPYPPADPILFHNESSHTHRWPTRQFFFCKQPALSGGATPIVDCRELFRALGDEMARSFGERGLRYVRNFIEGVDVAWQDFFKTSDRRAVEAYCREHGIAFTWKRDRDLMTHQLAPAVVRHPKTGEAVFFNQIQLHHVSCLDAGVREAMSAMFDPEDLPRNVYFGDGGIIADAWVDELRKLCQDRAVRFPWQAGDVLLVDNMAVAHGRDPYVPPRAMYVAMGAIMNQSDCLG